MVVQEVWTTLKILNWTKEYLLSKGVVNARLEAEWLLCAVMRLDRVGLYLQYDKPLNDIELAAYRAMVARRAKREPLQHILGSQEFYGLDYEVTPAVLIPRYDTELLISEAVKHCPKPDTVLDVGTGSGCIAVTLKKQFPAASVTATDVSEAALSVAGRNAQKHGAELELLPGSLFTPVAGRRFDLIVSNPPYIPTSDIEDLDPEVRDYDPESALDGGRDGLDFYRFLVPAAVEHLNPGGWLLMENGIKQADDIVRIFEQCSCYGEPIIALDTGGIERVVGAQLKETL